jgi:hypothetical protein
LGSSTSLPAGILTDCKTADGQGLTSMMVNVTLLSSQCDAALMSALLPVVQQAVADAAGSNSDESSYSVTAGGCSMRLRVSCHNKQLHATLLCVYVERCVLLSVMPL